MYYKKYPNKITDIKLKPTQIGYAKWAIGTSIHVQELKSTQLISPKKKNCT